MKRNHTLSFSLNVFFIFFCCLSSECYAQSESHRVLILTSRKYDQYNKTVAGIQARLKEELPQADVEVAPSEDYASKEAQLIKAIEEFHPQLIVSVGTDNTVLVQKHFVSIPIVFTDVLFPIKSGIVPAQKNTTGVCLQIEIERQFQEIKRVLPSCKSLGVLYDVKSNSQLKDQAEQAAKNQDLELIFKPIYSDSELKAKSEVFTKIDEVIKEADCLWAGIDYSIYNPQSAQHIILETLRHKIPFIAFSSNYVKEGALLSIDRDYYDIGLQTAEMVLKILKGQNPVEIPVELPRKLIIIKNENSEKLLGLQLPKE